MDAPQKTQPKAQPWKKAWPPQTKATAGEKHGYAKGEQLEVGGTSIAAMDRKRREAEEAKQE